jgi:hypothetical protein
MTQEQHDYEMGCAGQAQAEYEAQMAYYEYLDSLITDKQYQLHAVEIALANVLRVYAVRDLEV